jgi:hypothetical protein
VSSNHSGGGGVASYDGEAGVKERREVKRALSQGWPRKNEHHPRSKHAWLGGVRWPNYRQQNKPIISSSSQARGYDGHPTKHVVVH